MPQVRIVLGRVSKNATMAMQPRKPAATMASRRISSDCCLDRKRKTFRTGFSSIAATAKTTAVPARKEPSFDTIA